MNNEEPYKLSYDHANRVYEDIVQKQEDAQFKKDVPKLIKRASIVCFILITAGYFSLPVSRVRSIRIEGNSYLSKSYVESVVSLSKNSRFYLCIPFLVESKLISDPMIKEAKVTLGKDRTLQVNVTENKVIGYRYNDTAEVVFEDGSTAELKSEYLDIISRVPLISGFDSEEKTVRLAKAFKNVNKDVIEDMAEVSEYSLSYDAQSIKVLMRNGGYYIGSYTSLDKVNEYNAIYTRLNDKSYCIFGAEEGTDVAYAKVCPWNETAKEYWMDNSGNTILNSSHEKAVKHYYKDADGNTAVNGQGNPITIPINEHGDEVPDGDFLAHYEAGYYASGSLVLPQE